MGNTDSRLSFYKEMLRILANEEIIPLYNSISSSQILANKTTGRDEYKKPPLQSIFDNFYTSLVSSELPNQYLSAYLTSNELRMILTRNRTNFTNLVRFLSYTIVNAEPSSLRNSIQERRILLNSIRILIKLMPILYETNPEGLEAEIFWSKNSGCTNCIPSSFELDLSQGPAQTTVMATRSPPFADTFSTGSFARSNNDANLKSDGSLRAAVANIMDAPEPIALGQQLINSLLRLSIIDRSELIDDISIHTNNTASANMFFLEILQLFTTLFSKPLYKCKSENRFLHFLLIEATSVTDFNELISKLLKIIVRFDPRDSDPASDALFLASLQFLNITMKSSSDNKNLLGSYFENMRVTTISADIFRPLYELLSIIIETEESAYFMFCLPIYLFISNLLKMSTTICTQIVSQFGPNLFTISLIYCKAVSQDRTCAPLQQFLGYFITYLSSMPQVYSTLSATLKCSQFTFLPERVRNQHISIREFCIMQLSKHIIPMLKSQEELVDPCYLETLYNLIRIPSSLNYSACTSIQNLLATFYESIQLPSMNSNNYSRSLSFKLDLFSLLIHALLANILENYQYSKVLLFVLCRNEHILQQIFQLIEDLSQDSSRNRPLAPSGKSEEPQFVLPMCSGHKALVERLDLDYRPIDHDNTLLCLRPKWPYGMSIRSKQKLKIDSKLSKTWLGKNYAYALIKIIQIVNSEFPSIMKITQKEDLKRLLLHLKLFETSLLKLAQPILPLSLSRRTPPSHFYLSYSIDSDRQDRVVKSWLDYILWSDIFNTSSGKVYLVESDNDTVSTSIQGYPNTNSPNINNTNNTNNNDEDNNNNLNNINHINSKNSNSISNIRNNNNNNNNTAPGTPTSGSRPGNRLERFNSNGSILSRTNTNDDLMPKITPEVTSSPWFRIPWSNEDDTSFHSASGGDFLESKKSIKSNIWTGTYVKLFPLIVEPCASEFSIVDMTSSFLRKFRFNSTTSINSMDTMHTLSNYT